MKEKATTARLPQPRTYAIATTASKQIIQIYWAMTKQDGKESSHAQNILASIYLPYIQLLKKKDLDLASLLQASCSSAVAVTQRSCALDFFNFFGPQGGPQAPGGGPTRRGADLSLFLLINF